MPSNSQLFCHKLRLFCGIFYVSTAAFRVRYLEIKISMPGHTGGKDQRQFLFDLTSFPD